LRRIANASADYFAAQGVKQRDKALKRFHLQPLGFIPSDIPGSPQ